ncbi:hypothetical protein AmaxDRAFT_1061 [Limnospira maxima CS-328]|uniref:PIN domain-containing protein n=1 Tax=Limnospira maxima CS-328 TaxID=513049 RepID=B5VX19_LIMMA|nr:hypothetical protein AmaxDRAFT_1061 [Limnospira maxima CS-328]
MSNPDLVFLDAGIFIGALLSQDPRHSEARPIVESARCGTLLFSPMEFKLLVLTLFIRGMSHCPFN